ncbi:fimbrial protein [Cronobacter dublinensis]|jgi:type 1 fimbria pilin|uniref:Type 1 fimbrial protein n=2 Tax=Cronobacter TaxID=413496 RepID=A0A2T7AVT5_9ENTR|nr:MULTISPECIES: fimbrial protein [Cronobacter]EGT4360657.1 type 1 fimbrial protein [Cronobacter dublinensis]ELY3983590.1 type 1 fimbrial protein [Cronobacter muytjensii]ELY4517984.1 type 1 fimbrial protein [Cronobacter muytjensii]ELY4662679.1 type 1 fimbrial protein [Cronobacter muytjensii]ELY6274967.1 type 1 fimbrial protein [Cronobacter muytjensii]
MKKALIALVLSSLFTAGAVCAEDNSASLQISGTVMKSNSDCYIYVESSVSLSGQTDQLISQGTNATTPKNLPISIGNVGGYCPAPEKLSIQLHAVADDADGTVIANNDVSENGAKGVGIGVFDKNNNPLSVNGGVINISGAISEINLQLVKLNGQVPTEGSVHGTLTLDLVRL